MGFRNKLDEKGKVVRNKARLVAKGYSKQEGINQVYERITEEIQHGRCKRNEDSNVPHHMPWTGRGINKGGWDSVQSNDWFTALSHYAQA